MIPLFASPELWDSLRWVFTYLLLLGLLAGLPYLLRFVLNRIGGTEPEEGSEGEGEEGENPSMEQHRKIQTELKDLGYYDYVPTHDMSQMNWELPRALSEGWLSTELVGELVPVCRRLWPFSPLSLYERGGCEKLLIQLSPYFQAVGLVCHLSEYKDSPKDDGVFSRSLLLNGRHYQHFDHYQENEEAHLLAVEALVKMLNAELEIQGKTDRCYVAGWENLLFAHPDLFRYINSFSLPDSVRPYDDWDDYWNAML